MLRQSQTANYAAVLICIAVLLCLLPGEVSTVSSSKSLVDRLNLNSMHQLMKQRVKNPQSKKPVCLFLHGVGEYRDKGSSKGTLKRGMDANGRTWAQWASGATHGKTIWSASQLDYWGKLTHAILDICDAKFYFTNAKTRAWSDESLQNEYCQTIEQVKPDFTFTHSMGNVIVAAALKKGKCQGVKNTKWVNLQGPLRGTISVECLIRLCRGDKNVNWCDQGKLSHSEWAKFKLALTSAGGFCRYKSSIDMVGELYPAEASLTRENVEKEGLADIAAANSYASLCGIHTNANGKTLPHQVLGIGAKVVGYNEPNDGMVPLSSCRLPGKVYNGDKNILVKEDHLDGTGHSGPGSATYDWIKKIITSSAGRK